MITRGLIKPLSPKGINEVVFPAAPEHTSAQEWPFMFKHTCGLLLLSKKTFVMTNSYTSITSGKNFKEGFVMEAL